MAILIGIFLILILNFAYKKHYFGTQAKVFASAKITLLMVLLIPFNVFAISVSRVNYDTYTLNPFSPSSGSGSFSSKTIPSGKYFQFTQFGFSNRYEGISISNIEEQCYSYHFDISNDQNYTPVINQEWLNSVDFSIETLDTVNVRSKYSITVSDNKLNFDVIAGFSTDSDTPIDISQSFNLPNTWFYFKFDSSLYDIQPFSNLNNPNGTFTLTLSNAPYKLSVKLECSDSLFEESEPDPEPEPEPEPMTHERDNLYAEIGISGLVGLFTLVFYIVLRDIFGGRR